MLYSNNSMSRIVIDARESGTTTGRYIDKLVEYLHRLQPAHEIIILTKSHRLDFIKTMAPMFEVLTTPYPEFSFGEQLGFRQQLDRLHADLVHFGMVQQPVWYQGRAVTTMHDLTTTRFRNPAANPVIFAIKQQVYKWVNKRAAHKSAHILVPSKFVKQDIVHFANITPDKITVTYEAADKIPDAPKPVKGLENKPFVMYVGRPLPHKNLPRLIEAHQLVLKTHPDLQLVLAGKSDPLFERIANTVLNNNLQNITFTGFVSESQLRWLYEHAAAYAFPSLSEGFGLPGLEAMVHGAPVAASNATCLPEIYRDGAQYFDPLDVKAIAACLQEILDQPKLAKDLINRGKKVAAGYSWQRMAEQTLAVYQAVLERRP